VVQWLECSSLALKVLGSRLLVHRAFCSHSKKWVTSRLSSELGKLRWLGRGVAPHLSSTVLDTSCSNSHFPTHRLAKGRPVFYLNIPFYRFEEDMVVKGYQVKGGTSLLINMSSILHDSVLFPEPDRFDPERFLGPAGKERTTKCTPFGLGES